MQIDILPRWLRRTMALGVLTVAVSGCSGADGAAEPAADAAPVDITGAGATFPYPLYSRWFEEYNRRHPDVRINYQAIGSGGGIRQVQNGTVFFGATDGPMTDEQLAASPEPLLHLPTVIGSVVPAYNLPEVTERLNFPGPLLADIFLGRVTRWNDRAIAAVNPGVALPDRDITVVHRSDGSGTTFVWVDYLSKVSPAWKEQVGVGTSVKWPVGIGGKGNDGVAGLVKQTAGAIGYMEPAYARQNGIPFGAGQNAAGRFVASSIESVTAAADGAAATIPDDFRVSITNPPGDAAYPIASFTWLLIRERPDDVRQSAALVEFVRWALTEGQRFAPELGYSPLPASVVERELAALERVRVR